MNCALTDLKSPWWTIADGRGGVCALAACQAKKYFYEVTETVARAQHLTGRGIQSPLVSDWAAILDRKNAFTVNIPDITVNGLYEAGIDYHEGTARFIDPDTMERAGHPIWRVWPSAKLALNMAIGASQRMPGGAPPIPVFLPSEIVPQHLSWRE
nr:hypothetical protein [Desulfosarcina alkanivorans]